MPYIKEQGRNRRACLRKANRHPGPKVILASAEAVKAATRFQVRESDFECGDQILDFAQGLFTRAFDIFFGQA